MLTVVQALEQIVTTIAPLPAEQLPLADVLGLTLSADIHSPLDSPPFDKSLMDGYAVKSEDLVEGCGSLRVIEVITAGHVPTKKLASGQATQIMTGAPLPEGADAVIKVEETVRDGDNVLITAKSFGPGAAVIRRGTSVRVGDCVLRAGHVLNAASIGALAELGRDTAPVRRRPRVAILATGDELVPVTSLPGPGQIRNSNESMLTAQIESFGGIPVPLGIARDEPDELLRLIRRGLEFDVLVLSGGVSAGTLDLVPGTLIAAGVREVFHKVELKPGKPIWFGMASSKRCCVFGLPGNPVGSLVCCELFVNTALRKLMGVVPVTPQPVYARLEHDYSNRNDRPTYHPAKLTQTPSGLTVSLVPWHGSSDLCGTVAANGMMVVAAETRQYSAGDRVETFAW